MKLLNNHERMYADGRCAYGDTCGLFGCIYTTYSYMHTGSVFLYSYTLYSVYKNVCICHCTRQYGVFPRHQLIPLQAHHEPGRRRIRKTIFSWEEERWSVWDCDWMSFLGGQKVPSKGSTKGYLKLSTSRVPAMVGFIRIGFSSDEKPGQFRMWRRT